MSLVALPDFAVARYNMMQSQIRTNNVTDGPLLDAMAQVPREEFVPTAWRTLAYMDEAVPLGGKRALMAPSLFARLVQLAAIENSDRVLIVGGASGYSTAVLCQIAHHVTMLEENIEFTQKARTVFSKAGKPPVSILTGELSQGATNDAPFDAIIIEGAIACQPNHLLTQLRVKGRLVAFHQEKDKVGHATLWRHNGAAFSKMPSFYGTVAALPGFSPTTSRFSF